jgi:hypothetical protein
MNRIPCKEHGKQYIRNTASSSNSEEYRRVVGGHLDPDRQNKRSVAVSSRLWDCHSLP